MGDAGRDTRLNLNRHPVHSVRRFRRRLTLFGSRAELTSDVPGGETLEETDFTTAHPSTTGLHNLATMALGDLMQWPVSRRAAST